MAPPGEAAPTVRFVAPSDGAEVAGPRIVVEGVARDDRGVASVFLQVGPNVPAPVSVAPESGVFRAEVPIPPGAFTLRAVAYDEGGRASVPAEATVRWPSTAPDDAKPVVTITGPEAGSTPLQPVVLLRGRAEDDRAVVAMEVKRNGELLTERAVETEDFFAHWVRLVPLLPGEANDLEVTAYDASGHKGTATVRLFGRPVVDRDPPQVALTAPDPGITVSRDVVAVTGTAFDRVGLREVKVRSGVVEGSGEPRWSPYVAATTTDGFARWSATVPSPRGALRIEARAIDASGLATSVTRDLTSAYEPEWSDERAVPLRPRDDEPRARLNLDLDRRGIDEVIAPSIQETIRLLDVDPVPLITNTVTAIKAACGTRWQEDSSDPRHDCAVTELGRTFGADWRRSPEYSLVRILTMTPANVTVDGTSVARLRGLADALGIGGGFNTILAEVLGIPKTREVVPTGSVVTSLIERWMRTHPALEPTGGAIPVTLRDAMLDLAPVGPRLGPSGPHPGVLDPASPVRSVVFGDGFRMRIVADSNLRWHDGLSLARGKEYLALVDDPRGGGDVLAFDFQDPNRFQIEGLVDAPRVDMRFRILENGQFIPSCVGNDCRDNGPFAARRRGPWVGPSHELESIMAYAAFKAYEARRGFDKCYRWLLVPCAAHVYVGAGSDPSGWAKFDTVAGLGSPPDNQYIWELISEVSQVALHRLPGGVTLAEGDANVAFTVRGVPVGIDAAQMRSAVRPVLEAQKSVISARLLGDYARSNGAVDFFLEREGGASWLYFVNALDPLPAAPRHGQPGFFADPGLTAKVSETVDDPRDGAGGALRERLPLSVGRERELYAKDEGGRVYRLRVTLAANGEVAVRVAEKLR